MASLFTAPQFDGGTGITPEDGLQLFFFEEGTSTPKDTFTTEALSIANSNPVISDANGVFPEIWMAEGDRYKVRLWDKNDVLVGFGIVDPYITGVTTAEGIAALTESILTSRPDNVVDMILLSPEEGDTVSTKGYTTEGDGGQADYLAVAKFTEDDFGDHPSANPSFSWKLQGTTAISNVRQFGAKGDGSTDDTNAVQAAHDANDSVFFPRTDSSYQISSITLNDRAKFSSNDALIMGTTTGSVFFILDAVGASAENIEIVGFVMDRSVPGTGIAIDIGTNIRRCYVRFNRIRNFNKGIKLVGAYSSDVSFNEVRNNVTGIELGSGCHATTLINNIVNQNSARGLSMLNISRDVTIIGGAYQFSPVGIFADTVESLTISGDTYFEGNGVHDIHLVSCYTPSILATNTSSLVSDSGIHLEDCAGNCRIQGTTFSTSTSTTPTHIKISGGNGLTVIEDFTQAAGMANPITTTGAVSPQNVSIGSPLVIAQNSANKAVRYRGTLAGADEWTTSYTSQGTPSGRPTLQHESAASKDYRILTGGVYRMARQSDGQEIYNVNMALTNPSFEQKGHFRPFVASDGVFDIGSAIQRWKTIFATTGTINTSDERSKQGVRALEDKEKSVAIKLKAALRMYKFNDAVEKKGEDSARIHCGILAQEVVSIFSSEGLDASKYGLLCFDEWEEKREDVIEFDDDCFPVLDDKGDPVVSGSKLILDAGNRYGIRYDELLCFIIACI